MNESGEEQLSCLHLHLHFHYENDGGGKRSSKSKDDKSSPEGAKSSAENGDADQDEAGDDDGKEEKKDKGDEDGEGEDKPKKKMSPQKKRLFIILAIIGVVILIAGGVIYWLWARQYETTDDAFIDGHVSQISPRVPGQIQSLLIVDNQRVEAGQLIAEIDPRDYEMRLAQAEASQAQAVAQVALDQANIEQAEANVEVAAAAVFQADQDLKRFESVNPKAISRQQLDDAIANAKSAHAKLEANEKAVIAAQAQEKSGEASVQQADVEISNAQLQLSYTKITAPVAGRITRRTVEVGNVVAAGEPLLAIASNDLWVTANYKETQLTHMRVGQKVSIEVDAFPSVVFQGHIDSFQKGTGAVFSTLPAENATGNYVKVVQRVPVKIVFDDPQERDKYPLALGLSVDPSVTVR